MNKPQVLSVIVANRLVVLNGTTIAHTPAWPCLPSGGCITILCIPLQIAPHTTRKIIWYVKERQNKTNEQAKSNGICYACRILLANQPDLSQISNFTGELRFYFCIAAFLALNGYRESKGAFRLSFIYLPCISDIT